MHYTVTLDNADQAQYIADTIAATGDIPPAEVDGTTVTFGDEALDLLEDLTDQDDGYFGDWCVWVGGIGYQVDGIGG